MNTPFLTVYCPFSAEAEKNLSVWYILPEEGAWSNVTTNSEVEINDPELLHYRSVKSKSIFMNVQNSCLQPP